MMELTSQITGWGRLLHPLMHVLSSLGVNTHRIIKERKVKEKAYYSAILVILILNIWFGLSDLLNWVLLLVIDFFNFWGFQDYFGGCHHTCLSKGKAVVQLWTDLEPATRSEGSQKERNEHGVLMHPCKPRKMAQMNPSAGQEHSPRQREQTRGRSEGEGGWDEQGCWDWHIHTCVKQSWRAPSVSRRGRPAWCPVMTWGVGEGSGREVQEGGDTHPRSCFISLSSRNEHSTVMQLHSNF